jgi:putative ABC transport system permease protein
MTRTLRRIWNRLLGSVLRQGADSQLSEELDTHIQLLAEENVRRGVNPHEALRRARLQFGSVEATKESYRDQRSLPVLDAFAQDLRYGLRGIRKNPGFAATAILSLGIGIGANTAIFSLVNSVLLQPLAYKEPDRLFAGSELVPHLFGRQPIPVNPMHAREWAKQCPSVEDVAVLRSTEADVATGGDPVSVPAADVAANVFKLLGVEPILGRTFLPEEEQDGNQRVAILSESFWRSRFDADRSVIGKWIRIDQQSYQVIGVLPAWFRLPYGFASSMNTPFEIFRPLVIPRDELARLTGNHNYASVLRLRHGARVEQAVSEINVVQSRFGRLSDNPSELRALLTPVHDFVTSRARLALWMLTASVGAVLLIVCINLANLLLSRMASRSREAAIRTALGASRGRQFRMALVESLLLAGLGGAVGIVLANWSVQLLLVAASSVDLPRLHEVRVDGHVLAFAFCLTVLTGVVFGTLPAWRLTRNDPQAALRAGSHTITDGRRPLRLREGLISLEVCLSTALLIVAALLGTSLTRLLRVDKGFDADQVLTVDIGLSGGRYAEDAGRERFLDRMLARMSAIPGVQASGFTSALPTRGETWLDPIYLESHGSRHHPVNNRYASPGYFRAMNIGVRIGRVFEESDRGRSVAVLSERAAKLLWPGDSNPVGRTFIGEDNKPKTLVGIVAEVRAVLERDAPPMAYYPWWQRVPDGGSLVIRTAGDPTSAAGALRAAIRIEDPQLPIRTIATMSEVVESSVAERRFHSMLVIAFAVSALLVASLGIYGVVSYSVTRRRNELGIRMALGARRSELVGLVIRHGMRPVVLGLVAGLAATFVLGRMIRGLLFGVEPADPMTVAGVALVLLLVGLLACLVPAHRAASTDPLAALRFE